jgi:hypothetical protein
MVQYFQQNYNGGWTEDTDELVDTMALGDKSLRHVQDDDDDNDDEEN